MIAQSCRVKDKILVLLWGDCGYSFDDCEDLVPSNAALLENGGPADSATGTAPRLVDGNHTGTLAPDATEITKVLAQIRSSGYAL